MKNIKIGNAAQDFINRKSDENGIATRTFYLYIVEHTDSFCVYKTKPIQDNLQITIHRGDDVNAFITGCIKTIFCEVEETETDEIDEDEQIERIRTALESGDLTLTYEDICDVYELDPTSPFFVHNLQEFCERFNCEIREDDEWDISCWDAAHQDLDTLAEDVATHYEAIGYTYNN